MHTIQRKSLSYENVSDPTVYTFDEMSKREGIYADKSGSSVLFVVIHCGSPDERSVVLFYDREYRHEVLVADDSWYNSRFIRIPDAKLVFDVEM